MFLTFSNIWLELLLAFTLHMLIGAPEWLRKVHPARLFIWLEKFWEGVLREKMGFELRRAGMVLSLICLVVAFFLGLLLARFGWIVRVILMSFSFSCANLFTWPAKAAKALLIHDITKARQILSHCTKADTDRMTEKDCVMTVVLQMGHSLCDALMAPLFWISVFSLFGMGLPAAFMWICIDTMDTRLGNHSRKNTDIGFFSAKLSDVAGFFPAWLSGWSVIVAAAVCRMDFRRAIHIMDRDHKAYSSPNGGWAVAALSGALGIQLGGDMRINGIVMHRRSIGDSTRLPESDDITRARQIVAIAAGGALFLCVLLLGILR